MECPNCGCQLDDALLGRHLGAKGGSACTWAKRRAARLNGRRGGRPPAPARKNPRPAAPVSSSRS